MQIRNTHTTTRTTVLLGTFFLFLLLIGSTSVFASTEVESACLAGRNPTANLDEWETDVLGLVEGCTPLASEPWAEEDGFVASAIEEWETDVPGLQFFCAALDLALLASQIEDNFVWEDLSALQIECVVAYLARE